MACGLNGGDRHGFVFPCGFLLDFSLRGRPFCVDQLTRPHFRRVIAPCVVHAPTAICQPRAGAASTLLALKVILRSCCVRSCCVRSCSIQILSCSTLNLTASSYRTTLLNTVSTRRVYTRTTAVLVKTLSQVPRRPRLHVLRLFHPLTPSSTIAPHRTTLIVQGGDHVRNALPA